MALLTLENISINFGAQPLLDGVNLQVESGERVAIIGRNGSGKSTLMRLIQGDLQPDHGVVTRTKNVTTGFLPQEVPDSMTGTIMENVWAGLGTTGTALERYETLSSQIGDTPSDDLLGRLSALQSELDQEGGWLARQKIERTLEALKIDGRNIFGTLSGGMKRQALLAVSLVHDPDVLLLDEPTNHLDIETIIWLEDFLLRQKKTLIFTSHDRTFIKTLATRIVEIDRGNLSNWSCSYENYLRRKQAKAEAEEEHTKLQDKRLAEEEAWIRKGIRARRTRNEGRVRNLKKLREERTRRRQHLGTMKARIQEAERSGRIVCRATDVSYAYDEHTIVNRFSATVVRGDKIGILGRNGTGKTTLLKLLLGQIPAKEGQIEIGTRLSVSYFDQLRSALDPKKTVFETIGDGSDYVTVDSKSRHVISYMRDFLFTADRVNSPVSVLSGGERNRLLLALLFTKTSNVLVMDEPTNDLDSETLELLEELLQDYTGTILLVSHDRTFLNNVVTSTIAFEDGGEIREYIGGYDDWLRQRPSPTAAPAQPESQPINRAKQRPRKLSYKEKTELKDLPAIIEALEFQQEDIHKRLADPRIYQKHGITVADLKEELEILGQKLEDAYVRWQYLEDLVH